MSKADDLQARVETFADAVLDFCGTIPKMSETARFVHQLSGAATSVAANYRAARRARTHQEFTSKIGVVTEEADEAEYWLALAERHHYGILDRARNLHGEALELTKIFARSAKTAHRKEQNKRQSRNHQ